MSQTTSGAGAPSRPLGADAVLDALDPEQRQVASTLSGPLCVLAGAGTGKTRAITHRIAYGVHAGVYTPQQVLAVTFTARAAGEMRTRLRDLGVQGVQARTFHAAALRQLHYFWPQAIGGAAPEVMPHKAGLVAEAGSRLRLQLDRTAIRDLARASIERFDIRPPSCDLKTANFSGGNQQKIVIAREMERDPEVLLVGQPTRGVDIGAIEFIHRQIVDLRDRGKAILLVSVELDEIQALSDRIIVMFDGRISGERLAGETDERELGLLMAGIDPKARAA
jgi:ABC-type dipeptide/oligopeptide/nickel transport system ATPase subunit